jgi:hypothetical protein
MEQRAQLFVWSEDQHSQTSPCDSSLSAALLAGVTAQALAAEFYVIEDSSTKRCTVVDKSQP